MARVFIYCFLIIIAISSCERKSGRRSREVRSISSNTHSKNALIKSSPSKELGRNTLSGPEIFEKYNSAVFMIFTSDGGSSFQGSGFFISDNGIAVSNYHVFKGTTKGLENIKLSNGIMFKVKEIIAYDENEDYILFKVEVGSQKINWIPIADNTPRIGERVYAIGSPRGLENTFSSGEVSQLRGEDIIQISVPIDHGSSGGVLLNSFGEVIGITTSGFDDSGANLNFAISIQVIKRFIQ